MNDDVDSALLDRLRQRDGQAFELFFATYADRLYRLASGMLKDGRDAEEVVQATFLSAFEAIDRFEPHARLSTWLYRIAYNHALMLLRRAHPTASLPDEDTSTPVPLSLVDWSRAPEDQALSEEAQQMLRVAVTELPPGLRAAFILRDVEGLSTAECAQVQGLTESACKVRLHRARLLLRERLSVYFSEWVSPARKESR